MDPRHPELAITRMEELMTQFDRVLSDIRSETISSKLGGLEREGSLVIQEICLVAPRLHEAMMQTSRSRRYDLTHGVTKEIEPVAPTIDSVVAMSKEIDKFNEYAATREVVEETTDKIETVEEQNDLDNTILSYDTKKVKVNIVDKPKKRKTSKKKKAE